MKITDVKVNLVRIPFTRTSLPFSPWLNTLTGALIRVATDEGITGVGEAFGLFDAAPVMAKQVELLKPAFVGKDPTAITRLWKEMERTTYLYGPKGVSIIALSGIEMSLWDIAGKAAGVPVYRLLGGRAHERVRAYASLSRYEKPEDVVKVCDAMLQRGFTAIKLHEIEIPPVAATRKAVGDKIDIMLDVNSIGDRVKAVEFGRELEPYRLAWYEEPIWPPDDLTALAEVHAMVDIPIAAGENEYTSRGFRSLIESRAVDILQPSIYKVGGILQVKEIFTLAKTFGYRITPHCFWSLGPMVAATLHTYFSEPSSFIIETPIDQVDGSVLKEPLAPEKGFWTLSDKPGLGIEIDEKALAKYSY